MKFLASSGLEGRDLSKLNNAERRDADWFERQAQVALSRAFTACSFEGTTIYATDCVDNALNDILHHTSLRLMLSMLSSGAERTKRRA
jgi:hypothetical protein